MTSTQRQQRKQNETLIECIGEANTKTKYVNYQTEWNLFAAEAEPQLDDAFAKDDLEGKSPCEESTTDSDHLQNCIFST